MTEKAKNEQAIGIQNLFSIKGKTALVTGGSRGIGLMIARGYVEAGARVYITSRKSDVCEEVAKELSTIGTCISIPMDISTEQGILDLVTEINNREQSLDILVNNAGANWGAPIEEYPVSGFSKVMNLNLNSIFFLTRELVPILKNGAKHEDPSRVINIGSIDGIKVPSLETYAYSASKAALHHMTRVLAVKLAQDNITVNAVAPGPFESKMTEWLFENFHDQIVEECPLSRIGVASDMAGIAIYLSSRAGSFVTGTVIPVDGGICINS
jgi:NAD(P)-dependent dehydrogenase (short-subunit alcohol dehydrogenase family)